MDKKSLVYAGVTTNSNTKMLETAGSFYIKATYNGKKLRLLRNETYRVEMKTDTKFNDMFTYYGGNSNNRVNWNINKNEPAIYNDASLLSEQKQYDEYGEELEYYEEEEIINFYEMSAGRLGWINCDRFYEVKNTSTLAVRVNSNKPMIVRLVFRGINSVMPAYSNSNHFNQYEASGIPKGEKVLLLAYSLNNNNAVFGYKEITIGENKVENITLNNLSKSLFKNAVSELLSVNN